MGFEPEGNVSNFTDAYWPCACVKRDRQGRMTHLKAHHPSVKKCRRCGATKQEADRISKEIQTRQS